jgi:tetratricopeptide (TPR) repeat protein
MRAHWLSRVLGSLFLTLCVGLLLSCADKADGVYAEDLRATQSSQDAKTGKSIDELQRGIDEYKKDVKRTIKASENLGIYYRLLGVEYMNRQMYGEALSSLEQAIRIYPENEQLTYWAGVCAGRMAKAQIADEKERARLYSLAEKYYDRTFFLYPDHRPALFGLAVLYAMELGRPADAVPLLERYLAKDSSKVEVMTLLARTHVVLGNFEEAIALYGSIAKSTTASADTKREALENVAAVEKLLQRGTRQP